MAGTLLCALRVCVDSGESALPKRIRLAGVLWLASFGLAVATSPLSAWAVTPESPEVRALIESGLKFLETNTDNRLGGKCLVALAFHKDGASPEHPRIQEALKACRSSASQNIDGEDVYSNGLAIIFLAELGGNKNRDLIARFAGAMQKKQKPHGGWGYKDQIAGDTSQTQYAALSFWELAQIGIAPNLRSVEACTNWLLRTQDPGGAWGYQGKDPGESQLVKQRSTSLSMLAAGMGSTLILGNLLGLTGSGVSADQADVEIAPSVLQRADLQTKKKCALCLARGSMANGCTLRSLEGKRGMIKTSVRKASRHGVIIVTFSTRSSATKASRKY